MQTLKNIYELDNLPKSQMGVKPAVFTFGRMNPPTKGHQKLLDKVIELAHGKDHFVFVSQTHGAATTKNKNPLPYDTKLKFLKRLFPKVNFVCDESVRSPFQVVEWLHERGYGNITFVVGSDRVEEFQSRLKPFAEKQVNKFEVVNAGRRDPDSTDVGGMSGTKAREAAIEGDIGKFRAATGWSGEIVNQLMTAVRKGLGVE